MRATKTLFAVIAVLVAVALLSGCISLEVKLNRDGSCDVTYIIDTSSFQGMQSASDVERTVLESVDEINSTAGKNVARLKGIRENKKEKRITATISISNVNELGDGTFFGTVRQYRHVSGHGLDNLMDIRERKVDRDDIPDDLYLFYMPALENDRYCILEVTVNVPGTIKYLASGAKIEKRNVARFSGEMPLVVFKKGEIGFPVWFLPTVAGILIIAFFLRKKPTTAAPVVSPPVTTNSPGALANSSPDTVKLL